MATVEAFAFLGKKERRHCALRGLVAAAPDASAMGRGGNQPADEMVGADALVRAIVESGITTCFANPGTTEMHI
eukprot:1014883-Prymnesium_polylepis.1